MVEKLSTKSVFIQTELARMSTEIKVGKLGTRPKEKDTDYVYDPIELRVYVLRKMESSLNELLRRIKSQKFISSLQDRNVYQSIINEISDCIIELDDPN